MTGCKGSQKEAPVQRVVRQNGLNSRNPFLFYFVGVLFGYKGVLLLFGILLAYETRNVKIKQVNDSRFVGMSIYNIVVSIKKV